MKTLTTIVCAMVLPFGAAAQYNLDWNTQVLPSADFGAASDQRGLWFQMGGWEFIPLRDLDGQYQGAWLTKWYPDGMIATGHNNFTGNTGEFKALLDDFYQATPYNWFYLQRLRPGSYDIYTYAGATLDPMPGQFKIGVAVSRGGMVRSPLEFRTISTPMPGNVFIEGVTHTKHRVVVQFGEVVEMVVISKTSEALVSGMQIVPVS